VKRHVLRDITSWVYKGGELTYTFFTMAKLHQSRIFTYGDKDTLLEEWICLDSSEQDIVRVVRNLSDVFGKIGGLQHLIVLVFSFFFTPYTHIKYKIEAFNEFFKVKSQDPTLVTKDNLARVSFC